MYELLTFYGEYIPAFAELVEPLYQILGQKTQPWIKASEEYIREVLWHIIMVICHLNADLSLKLRIETGVSSQNLAAFQHHTDKP